MSNPTAKLLLLVLLFSTCITAQEPAPLAEEPVCNDEFANDRRDSHSEELHRQAKAKQVKVAGQ